MIAFLAAAVAPALAPAVFTQPAKPIAVKAGTLFLVALPANPTTGYRWSAATFAKPGIAASAGAAYLAPGVARPGAGGTQLILLRAAAPGTTTATFGYARPWETGVAPARTATFTITVTP